MHSRSIQGFDMTNQKLQEAVAAHQHLSRSLQEASTGIPVGEDTRCRIARLCWQQAMEDCAAIGVLLASGHTGSARALARPQTEVFLRGWWTQLCAEEYLLERLVRYDAKAKFPSLGEILRDLKASQPITLAGRMIDLGQLSTVGTDALHDLTHRGMRAIARLDLENQNHGSGRIADDLPGLLHIAAGVGAISVASLIEDSGRDEDAQNVMSLLDVHLKRLEDAFDELRNA
jgi:hypothetical protein